MEVNHVGLKSFRDVEGSRRERSGPETQPLAEPSSLRLLHEEKTDSVLLELRRFEGGLENRDPPTGLRHGARDVREGPPFLEDAQRIPSPPRDHGVHVDDVARPSPGRRSGSHV